MKKLKYLINWGPDVKINLDFIKNETVGKATVNEFTISKYHSQLTLLKAKRNNRLEDYIKDGTYKRLYFDGKLLMSNTQMEINSHLEAFCRATGTVLIAGLGLGMYLYIIKDLKDVKRIIVVEKEKDIIDLIGKYFIDDKIEIINADIFEYETDEHFDFIWIDIWDSININNIKEMELLKKKFSKNSDSILCWSEDMINRK